MTDYNVVRSLQRNKSVIVLIEIPALNNERMQMTFGADQFERMSAAELDWVISSAVERKIATPTINVDQKIKELKEKKEKDKIK